jgi:hypothetical protein
VWRYALNVTNTLRDSVLTALALVAAASTGAAAEVATTVADDNAAANAHYSWQLDEASRRRIFEGIKALSYGETISETKRRLGSPTIERDDIDKSGTFKAHELRYAIRRIKLDGVNVKDQEIALEFNKRGHLFRVVYSAMTPLAGTVTNSYVVSQTRTRIFFTRPPEM